MTPEVRHELLSSALVIDNCPLNQDIDQQLQEEIWSACHRSHTDKFLIYLEGWWFKRILKGLDAEQSMPILEEELDARLDELREQFKSDALPIHEDLKTATVDHELYHNYVFVHQLKLIEVGIKRIALLLTTTTDPLRNALDGCVKTLFGSEIWRTTKNNLWRNGKHIWRQCVKILETDDATEREKIKAARAICYWAEKEADIPIRPLCREPFVT